ncbi:MAG: alpha/beta hydrolase [Candidatus Rokubacteria bacterium]|nr:alpha/beta hydrolase [Candidatus Rokubacteria bacterium]
MLRRLTTRAAIALGFLTVALPAAGQVSTEFTLRGDCQTRLHEYQKKPYPGHFFYVEDPGSTKYRCGFSFEDPGEFDRYPSSAQTAFSFCQNGADERGIKAQCAVIARGAAIVARSYAEAQSRQDTTSLVVDSMRCGQTPLSRWAWAERAFCDLPWHGPAKASGIVIWNHGIFGTSVQYAGPVPPVFRLLQSRGWDVVKIARNNLGETSIEQSLYQGIQRTVDEITVWRREGYARVILAGQSFGGYITLDAAESSKDIYGVVAMAPGVTTRGGGGRFDAGTTERTLGRLSVERLVLILPRNDQLFNSVARGPGAVAALAGRAGSSLLLDERYDIVEHGGGTTGKFAIKYGPCLVQYVASLEAGKGSVHCQEDEALQERAAKELLPRLPNTVRLSVAEATQTEGKPIRGQWYGILEPSGEVVSYGIADVDGVGPRAMFRSFSGWRRGGLYAFSVSEGAVTFRLSDRGSVMVKERTLTWTPADGRSPQTAKLLPLGGS